MADSGMLTISCSISFTPEPGATVEEKEALLKQLALDQAAAISNTYSWGITVSGYVGSDITESNEIQYEKPPYEDVNG